MEITSNNTSSTESTYSFHGGNVVFDEVSNHTYWASVISSGGNRFEGTSMTTDRWAQMMWVPNIDRVTTHDIWSGGEEFSWIYVTENSTYIQAKIPSDKEIYASWRFHNVGNGITGVAFPGNCEIYANNEGGSLTVTAANGNTGGNVIINSGSGEGNAGDIVLNASPTYGNGRAGLVKVTGGLKLPAFSSASARNDALGQLGPSDIGTVVLTNNGSLYIMQMWTGTSWQDLTSPTP